MPTLNWIGKDEIVQHDKEVKFKLFKKIKGCSVGDKSKNLLIHGDNLEALKALMPYYQGQIKCIYIDPPYNTGNKLDKLNKEEKSFVDDLDLEGENIKFWVRCREKKEDSFALQGWEDRKFYPDFAAITKKGNMLAFEWKGEHLEDNKDSEYKKELGKTWEKLGKGLHFFFVTNKNKTEVLKEIREL